MEYAMLSRPMGERAFFLTAARIRVLPPSQDLAAALNAEDSMTATMREAGSQVVLLGPVTASLERFGVHRFLHTGERFEYQPGELELLADAVRLLTLITFDESMGDLNEVEGANPALTGVSDWHSDDLFNRKLVHQYAIGDTGEYGASETKEGTELIKQALAIAVRMTQPGLVETPSPSALLFAALGKDGCQVLSEALDCEANPEALESVAAVVREATEYV